VFLDITATVENRPTLASLVRRISEAINIPFTVGGGIKNEEDVSVLLDAGCDKISINSMAVRSPGLIDTLADRYGSQCVVCAIDARSNPSMERRMGSVCGWGAHPHRQGGASLGERSV
jgi:cyclase